MKKYIKWFGYYWKKSKLSMIGIFILTVLTISAKTAFPILLKYIVDLLDGKVEVDQAYKLIIVYAFSAVIHGLLVQGLPVCRGLMNMINAARIRNKYFKLYTNKDHRFFKKFNTGDLLTRLTDDVDGNWDRLSWYSCSGIFRPIEAIMILAFTLGVMFYYSIPLTLFTFIPLPFLVIILAKTEDRIVKYTSKKQKSISHCNNVLESCFSGIRVIKSTLSEKDQLKKYDEALEERIKREKDFLKLNQIIQFFSMLVNHFGSIIVIFIGSYYVLEGRITLGTFFLFINYMQRLIEPIWTLSWFYASSKQVFQYVDRLVDTEDYGVYETKVGEDKLSNFDELHLESIDFKFDDAEEPLFRNVNIDLKKGEILAIVGPVGSGKTTLLELISGNILPNQGQIKMNKNEYKDIPTNELANKIGYIRQENVLFSETIENNLLLGDEFTTEDIKESLIVSLMDKEVANFPKKMGTVLGQKGLSLSGGQKQRLSIARSLVRKPELLLLDDCTAAMDAETEKKFWKNLKTSYKGMSCIVVTHRLATAMEADKIIVLQDGKIQESGTHSYLTECGKFYQKLMKSQQESA
jgi:ATP-binding cassette subfamily B protein